MYRAVLLTLFLLRQVTLSFAGHVRAREARTAVLVDEFLAPTGKRTAAKDMSPDKRHAAALTPRTPLRKITTAQ